ncbi:hypothetical protein [Demequina sp.]|uniref:hypothetical protein n=1 Tax=Demequina sp. TaxID=2050685 RepID=UPI003D0D0C3C
MNAKPATNRNALLAALSSAALVLLTIHASENGSFSETSTFVGMFVGVALATAGYLIAKRVIRGRER